MCTGIRRRDFQSGKAALRQQTIHTHTNNNQCTYIFLGTFIGIMYYAAPGPDSLTLTIPTNPMILIIL